MSPKSSIVGAALLAVAPAVYAAASCSSFEVVNQTYSERGSNVSVPFLFRAGYDTYRVSNGLVCDDAHTNPNCVAGNGCQPALVAGTVVNAVANHNLTQSITKSDATQIFTLAGSALNIPFPLTAKTTMGNPGAVTYNTCVGKGSAAYLDFVPEYNCAEGILHCDEESDVPDQTPVYLCAPAYVPGGNSSELSGDVELIETSVDIAKGLTTLEPTPSPIQGYPASSPAPVSTPYPGETSQTPVPLIKFRKLARYF